MKAFILSAGLGTRLKLLTSDRPKVMVEVGNKPVLQHLIELCARNGLKEIIINLHYLPEVITHYFGDGSQFGVIIHYSYEKEKIMGGAGALKYAASLIGDEPICLLNGDEMMTINLRKMIEFHTAKKAFGTFLVHDTDHPFDSDLVECDGNQRIVRFFRPKPDDVFKPISKSGVHIFEPDVLNYIPSNQEYSLEKELIPDLLEKDKLLYAYYSNEYAKDMGTPERLERVKKDWESGKIM